MDETEFRFCASPHETEEIEVDLEALFVAR